MKKLIIVIFTCISLSLVSLSAFSQCAMCRRTAETSQANNEGAGRGLNKGIIYLLSVPYLLGGIGAFIWYKNRKNN